MNQFRWNFLICDQERRLYDIHNMARTIRLNFQGGNVPNCVEMGFP